MKRGLLALALIAVMAGFLAACSDSDGGTATATPAATQVPEQKSGEESRAVTEVASEAASSQSDPGGYEPALVTDPGAIDNKSSNQGAWEGLRRYAEGNSISHKHYQPQGRTTDSHLETIELTIESGAKLVVCPGLLFEEPIFIAQDKYPDIHLTLLDDEPHDADYNYKMGSNVVPILFQEGQASSLAGYTVVRDDCTKMGFMSDMAVPAVIRLGYDFVQGAEHAMEEDGITGIKTIYSCTGGSAVTPEVQSMAASQYQNGTEVVPGCGGAVGDSVMATTQEKNAKTVGVDVNQSSEFEAVITSAMKLLSDSAYDGVKDFYDGSFSGGKTSVFTVANNGVGLPMDTSKFEKFTQEQHDTIYKKLVDGEITLVQFSRGNNNPTMDLISLTNNKVTFAE